VDVKIKKRIFLILASVMTLPAIAADFDPVIMHGRVMDPEAMRDQIADKRLTQESYEQLLKDGPGRQIVTLVPANQGRVEYWLQTRT